MRLSRSRRSSRFCESVRKNLSRTMLTPPLSEAMIGFHLGCRRSSPSLRTRLLSRRSTLLRALRCASQCLLHRQRRLLAVVDQLPTSRRAGTPACWTAALSTPLTTVDVFSWLGSQRHYWLASLMLEPNENKSTPTDHSRPFNYLPTRNPLIRTLIVFHAIPRPDRSLMYAKGTIPFIQFCQT